ncbi:MAG TPA: glyoxalase [Burkholderiaceae bacterium]
MSVQTPSTLIPAMRYRDAVAAIERSCKVFGFHKHLVLPGDGGAVHHAQRSLGGGMPLLGTAADNAFGKFIKQPDETGGVQTQSTCIVAGDPDAVHARAVLEGAEIARAMRDEDYGGRGFACRDLDGHLRSVGAYDPWKEAH